MDRLAALSHVKQVCVVPSNCRLEIFTVPRGVHVDLDMAVGPQGYLGLLLFYCIFKRGFDPQPHGSNQVYGKKL